MRRSSKRTLGADRPSDDQKGLQLTINFIYISILTREFLVVSHLRDLISKKNFKNFPQKHRKMVSRTIRTSLSCDAQSLVEKCKKGCDVTKLQGAKE